MWKNKKTIKCDKYTVTCDIGTTNVIMEPLNVRNNRETTKCNKRSITCDVSTTQYEDGTIKCEKKKITEPPNVTKLQSHMILVLHNLKMVPLNVRKNKETTECDKSTITCDVDIAQCEDGTIKYKKKIREPSTITKVQSHVMLVLHKVRIIPSNVRKKNKRTIECDKNTITCDVGTV